MSLIQQQHLKLCAPIWQMLKNQGINDSHHFNFMDAPPDNALISELGLLFALDGLNGCGELIKLRRKMTSEEKRRELDNREICLERNEKDQSLENQKREAYICERKNMLRMQEDDLNVLELKIKDAKSELTSDQTDLSKLAIFEIIFELEF